MLKKTVKAAFVASLPVLMGYVSMGIAFGILLVTQVREANGFWAFGMSVSTISGSMQFAAVDLLKNSAAYSLPLVALLTVLINIRYAMYGLPFIELFKKYPWYLRFYLILCLTDETYALQVQDKRRGRAKKVYLFCVAFFNHSYWVIGSIAGAVAGKFLPFNTRGIDFAMTALFLVILVDLCRDRCNRVPALIGGAATAAMLLVFVLWFPAHVNKMLLPAMFIMVAVLIGLRRRLEAQLKPVQEA